MNLFKMEKHRMWTLWIVARLLTFSTSIWTQSSLATGCVSNEKGELLIGINEQKEGALL